MYVKGIEVENWLRYRGLHGLALEPGVYAVTATYEHDDERSNWAGKTGLLYSVRFALYGDHPRPTEDEWITDGESMGRVQIRLSDETLIERSRHRGKATRLRVARGEHELRDDDAQRWIIERIGLGEKDHGETCFFKQKQMSRFVTAQPADRLKIVSAWLDLAGIQRCESNVTKRLGELLDVAERAEQRRQVVAELLKSVTARYEGQALVDVIERAKAEVAELEVVASEIEDRVGEGREWRVKSADARRYAEICERGKELRAQVEDEALVQDEEDGQLAAAAFTEAKLEESRARDKLGQSQQLARGEFDGRCPVMRMPCPAKAKVIAAVSENRELVRTCQVEVDERRAKTEEARRWADEVNAKIRKREALDAQLGELRGQALELYPAHEYIEQHGEPPDDSELRAEADAARMKANAASVRLEEAKRAAGQAREYEGELARLRASLERNATDVATHREALLIFGRNGAQRRIAEGALARIEQDANALLAESGIDLHLAVRWSREAQGKDLAPTCGECGEPFARGRSVKECPRCGAKRGPKTVDKLDLELSNVSGAAEDLAGVAFQLAAAAWLRAERGAAWGMVEIDEPFGSLDGSARKALATALVTMLRGRYGFEQALVVSHSQDVNDMMPRRIRIMAGLSDSRIMGVD